MTELTFPEAFARHAGKTPDAVAVEFLGDRLTYRDLDVRATVLAATLRAEGVGPGSIVGVAATPSTHLPVALLAILRAGGAWLPLDPAYPVDRLRFMSEDAGVRLLVADPAGASAFYHDAKVIDPADPAVVHSGHTYPQPPPNPYPHPAPADRLAEGRPPVVGGGLPGAGVADLAYVIYTSGSTGRPKGVAVTHGGLANLIHAQADAFAPGPGDRVLQFAPTSFDASVFEIVMALATGATLVLAPRNDLGPGPALADVLRQRKITHLTVPPSVLATLPDAELPELAVLICAGEALAEHLVDRWQPGRRMFNAYGPTETTVWATIAELTAGHGKPTIGAAITGARVAVVDEWLQPVPDGTPGELVVGGRGVARGYLGRPGLTAQRFVPDPAEAGARLYRTGDLAVVRDGALEFLGRLDNQVKVRGFRIEPEEIATRLAEHPSVTDAVVVARDLGWGPELVGYVAGTEVDTTAVKAHCAARLPAHMVPGIIVVLARMPLTPSGKIDRDVLPAPETGDGEYVAPTTATERALAVILADLLAVERVGMHDEFFAVGGNSLLAGRLAARVRADLGRELPLRLIYQVPTVAAMAAAIDAGDAGLTVPPVKSTTLDGPAPLAFPQERVWYLEKLAPGNLAYNAQATLRLRGPLRADVLRATLTEIVRRHEVFRCAFVAEGGRPTQRPVPPMPVDLPVIDLGDLPEDERDVRAEEIVAATVRDPFDLARPPLARWVLIRHGEDDHTLVHVEHHLVHDGWSFALFLQELQAIYPHNGQSALPDPEVRYTDFARWQREWMRDDVLDANLAHWTKELAGCPTALDLPTDRPRPRTQSFQGAALRVDVPAALCGRLRDYSRARGVTLFTTMLSGFAVLLSRHSGQRDMVIGSGVANRRLAELESLIGMIVNTLPLRVDLTGEPGFDDLVQRTHASVGRAAQWQDVPIERLIDAMRLTRDPGRNPLFQAMFSFHDSQVPVVDFGGVTGSVLERHNGSAKTDINVVAIPRAEQRAGHGTLDGADPVTLIWEYATDLFDAETMREYVDRYIALLTAAVDNPMAPIDQLPLITAEERDRLVALSAGTVTAYPADRTIPELFAEQVAARPDAQALVHGDRAHTYAELDACSSRIAHLLRARGVGPDVPVGVLLHRGDDMVTALLAVLKAGGAYVPLDPAYPAQRLAGMVDDVGVDVVITRSDLRHLVDVADVLALDTAADELAAADPAAPMPTAGPENLAYVLFTSGSTGRPKGVMVAHRSVLRLVCDTDYADFRPGLRYAQVADASFDALTYELWGALLHGGTVCVVDTDTLLTAGGLRTAIRTEGITSMFLTSALFTEIMADHPDTFAGMTTLMVGGDALNLARVRRLLDGDPAHRPANLVNGYGPTEATTFAVCHSIVDLPLRAPSVPIGRPIANTTGYVLDRRFQPVPVGVAGELFLGGPGVARGYAGRPGLTAQRFVPDPFAADGSRLYRTGDLVRYRRDGVIEFLGRVDNQVKIRGFRVEPGEVDAAIAAHDGVAQAAVVVDEAPSGRRLVAYVVPAADGATADLRDFLARRLPPYLLPSVYVLLPALPMTTSGKVDRAALPPVDDARVEPVDHRLPVTDTERAVAKLAAELLGLPSVGTTDDFFHLGGHSLLAMRLVARTNELFGTEVGLRAFLGMPTVGALASAVDAAPAADPPPTSQTESDELLLAQLDELSEDEVEELLRGMAENEVDR
ncbi:non-ribosomal peptide synthetase [Actinokineospora xionganensis]|uniref:Amino acid adenylation domain-containing protein n=1 Tax=Actinokineospora xionganensis TaxID=2684470 RepID=A0ABR7L5E2_9PSEU|nr:non-ribosomal peptide synthetase [Actinokineospora xionganensis]MBC6447902.1 amino acid adenylation domain-containing protein [Actinokineospora xionganensis]